MTSERMRDIYTAIISDEESDLGLRDYGGASFFFAVIFDHSMLGKMIRDAVERPEVAGVPLMSAVFIIRNLKDELINF